MSTASTPPTVLSDELLIRCLERAPLYDRENRFAQEDFDELQQSGYLTLPLPAEFGGRGFSLADVVGEQRRLAYFAGPTAEAITMHLAWLGVAAERWRQGDQSVRWMLEEAAAGRVFTAGHAEAGHDVPLTASMSTAHRVQGGFRFTGRKSFSTLGPVWSYMGLHALDESIPHAPRIVHAFMPRNTEGYVRREGSTAMGMRATRRDEALLDNAFIPDRYVIQVVAADSYHDPFVVTLLAWQLLGHAAVSVGMARRALDLAVESLRKTQHAVTQRPLSEHPGAQHRIADMGLELEAIEPHLEQLASAWTRGVAHGARWPMKLLAAKYHAVEGAWRVIDTAIELAGGVGVSRQTGLEQLFRDARLGRVHPASAQYVREVVGRTLLGMD